jgi:uncharacterized membrane protein YebE (DUF533 family)
MSQRLILALSAVLVTVSAAVANAGPIENRLMRQQHKIRIGVRTGQITHHEFARLRERERTIRFAIAEARHDGRLSRRERMRIDQHLDRQDLLIERLRHNARTA